MKKTFILIAYCLIAMTNTIVAQQTISMSKPEVIAYARKLFSEKNYAQMEKLLPNMDYDMLADLYTHTVELAIMKLPVAPHDYVDISIKMVRQLLEAPASSEEKAGSQRQAFINRCLAMETEVLQRSGRNSEAARCMEMIADSLRLSQYPQGNEAYAKALLALGRDSDASATMEAAASIGQLTGEMVRMLREHYEKTNPKPAASWEAYRMSLKSPAYLDDIKKQVSLCMVDEPYKSFAMKDANGKEVKSASFDDDIVVLDFWATWCAPCIAALEGMQMAVNEYKNNPSVKFYFVNTQDNPDNKAKVINVWKRKGYSLNDMPILFDNCTTGKKDMNLVYKSMFANTSSIPQKVILKGGRIRYRSGGYVGSPSVLADELTIAISILK